MVNFLKKVVLMPLLKMVLGTAGVLFSDPLVPSAAHCTVKWVQADWAFHSSQGPSTEVDWTAFLLLLTAETKGVKVGSQMVWRLGSWNILGVTLGATIQS